MDTQTPQQAIQRYLEDAIAAEQTFENQLRTFAAETDDPTLKALFAQHAEETQSQQDRLTARLAALGGHPSGLKSFLGTLFGMMPKTAQVGHHEAERSTQDLMMAFAVEHSEIAMYEALAVAAEAAGDTETAALARQIQAEEQKTAEKIWSVLGETSRRGFLTVTGGATVGRAAV